MWIASAAPGAQLPTTRELTARHSASPVTVQKALRTLVAQGVIETRPGAGAFVRTVRRARSQDFAWQTAALGAQAWTASASSAALRAVSTEMIALHSGYPDRELLPERLVRAAITRAARGDSAVSRPPSAGMPELQSWVAMELGRQTPAGFSTPTARDVIVLPGSQLGLGSLFRSIVGAGGVLLVESPTYWGAILAASQVGVTLVPVSTGVDGPDLEALDRAFTETGARAFYAQPSFANPTGVQWGRPHADAVLGIVRAHRAFLIEDDWAHDFAITSDASPLAARDDGGHVVYLRSLTKSVSPTIRVAAIVARGPLRERLLADLQAQTMYVSGVLQAAALEVVTQPAWNTHLRGLRQQLAARRDLLIDAVHTRIPTASIEVIPAGGLNLWVRLDDDTDLVRLARECEARAVMIATGDEWFPAEPTGRYIRLNFAGPNPGAFDTAAQRIGEALVAAASS
ncbi:transcriptional regulator with HTH domain and aminotransferase domain [Actinoalloteichus hymeniacidonis]|uniref:Transcriptional regulator with HTH domain and aminotransferase domain n=1 Tax=Actinoalloteichus hymeniacidonis TaxID=340345 RepID=A0AAC9MZE5_9PSEU|nr:transcriptional regulator with HTH domain and aminotransferase domain [Actinoalloteichus hymeniacidonis]